GEAVGQEGGQVALVGKQHRAGEPLEDVPAHQPGGAVGLGAIDVALDQLQGAGGLEAGLVQGPADGARLERQGQGGGQVGDEPLDALQGLAGAQAEAAGPPPAQAGGGEEVESLGLVQRAQGGTEEPADEQLAGVLQGPGVLLPAAAEQGVDELEEQVLEEVGVLLVDARGDQQLPGALRAVLDRVEQVGLAGALVAQHRDDLGVGGGGQAVEVDDGQELLALEGEKLGDVV